MHDPTVLSGPWGPALALLSEPWMAGLAFSEDGAPVEKSHQLALTSLLGFSSLATRLPLHTSTLVIRVPSHAVACALARGSSDDPALQDIVMLLQTACMDLLLARPLPLPCCSTAAPALC